MNTKSALGLDIFDKFASSTSCELILHHFSKLCQLLEVERPTRCPDFLKLLKGTLTSNEFRDLLAKYEHRLSSKVYSQSRACAASTVLVIGAGPCGLRAAVECQLLGARVIVVEKRDDFTRNNVLHLWPFVMHDLRDLGAKRFCPKFCSGSIDHVRIATLQCILLKIAVILGVEVYTGVEYHHVIEPTSTNPCWRAATSAPPEHELNTIAFDVILGADGHQQVLAGFRRKELRGKLAIAITANFVNFRTAAEVKVQEISGVSSIFRQALFQNLTEETGIDLENIVYYKDETHYFVMTAKKSSLLAKRVLRENFADTVDLLAPENIDMAALTVYVVEAVRFVTEDGLPNFELALNHQGKPDLSIFDFTRMYAAENSCRVLERHSSRLLMGLVGDCLLEPFWPTGSGCARGFLSALDAAWMIRSWARGEDVLDVLAERETIYRLLAQTTHDNLSKDYKSYTVDPTTRYPNLVTGTVQPSHVSFLYDTHCEAFSQPGAAVEKATQGLPPTRGKRLETTNLTRPLCHRRSADVTREGATMLQESEVKRSPLTLTKEKGCLEPSAKFPLDIDQLVDWLRLTLDPFNIQVSGIHDIFVRGDVLCSLIHVFRPDLIPQYPFDPEIEEGIDISDLAAFRNQIAFDFLNDEYSLPYIVSGYDSVQYTLTHLNDLVMYLFQVYAIFSAGNMPEPSPPRQKLVRSSTFSVRNSHKSDQEFGEFESPNRTGRCIRSLQQRFQSFQCKPSETPERRSVRRRNAESCKLKAMEFINSIQSQRNAVDQDQIESRRQQTIKTIRAVCATQPESGAQTTSGSTKANDDFFNEYNLRLWRQSLPSMEERVGKLQSALAAPLPSSKTVSDPVTSKKALKRAQSCATMAPPGAAARVNSNDWVQKLLAKKFPDAPPLLELSANESSNPEEPQDEIEVKGGSASALEGEDGPVASGATIEKSNVARDHEDYKAIPSSGIVDRIPERACYFAQSEDEEDEGLLDGLNPDELEDLEAWSGKYL